MLSSVGCEPLKILTLERTCIIREVLLTRHETIELIVEKRGPLDGHEQHQRTFKADIPLIFDLPPGRSRICVSYGMAAQKPGFQVSVSN